MTILGAFTACGNTNDPETTPAPTEPAIVDYTQQAGSNLKILTLGHSLAVDAGHRLALIAAAEGITNLTVGTLYYSGCPLNKHVEFSKSNLPNYQLYLSNSNEGKIVPSKMESVTMKDALRYQDWDIIIMQGGVFEIAKSETYTNGDIQTIQNYVKENAFKRTVSSPGICLGHLPPKWKRTLFWKLSTTLWQIPCRSPSLSTLRLLQRNNKHT